MRRLFIEAHRHSGLHIWWKGRGVHIFLRRGALAHRVYLDKVPW